MKISVIGLGYVGLPTAALFASKGIEVIGVDINQHIINLINSGNVHIIEPGLNEIVKTVVSSGYLQAVSKPQPADVFIIAVPTPINENKAPDLSAFKSAIHSIAPILRKGNLVIIESTVPLKTVENTAHTLRKLRPDLTFPTEQTSESDISIAYCPERVLPGQTIRELCEIARTIGGLNDASAHHATEVYRIFCKGEIILTNALTAEMVKLAENSYRDVNIAFANELSMLCDEYKINVHEVIALANRHPRVNILSPGAGVGGHCIPVDPWFIVDAFPEKACIIRNAREVNDAKTEYVYQQILNNAKKLEKPKIAILGISYKANIDDLRGSPAITIIHKLKHLNNITLYVADPFFETLPLNLAGINCIRFVAVDEAIMAADIVAILTGHDQFKTFKENITLQKKCIIDAVGITYMFKNKSIQNNHVKA